MEMFQIEMNTNNTIMYSIIICSILMIAMIVINIVKSHKNVAIINMTFLCSCLGIITLFSVFNHNIIHAEAQQWVKDNNIIVQEKMDNIKNKLPMDSSSCNEEKYSHNIFCGGSEAGEVPIKINNNDMFFYTDYVVHDDNTMKIVAYIKNT